MKSAPNAIPPLLVVAALAVSSASSGFSFLAFALDPFVLAAAAFVFGALVRDKVSRSDAHEIARSCLGWAAFGLLIALTWRMGAANGYFSTSDIAALLGFEQPLAAPWFKVLLAAAFALLFSSFLNYRRTKLLWISTILFFLGTGGLLLGARMQWKTTVKLVPSQIAQRVYVEPSGLPKKLPFSMTLRSFELSDDIRPYLLEVSDRNGKTLDRRFFNEPVRIPLPSTDSVLDIQPERIPATVKIEPHRASQDYNRPAVHVMEFADDELTSNYVLFGIHGMTNCVYLNAAGVPAYFRYYSTKEQFNAFASSGLSYAPYIELRSPELGGRFTLIALEGEDVVLPNSHYKLSITKSNLGHLVTGEQGSATVEVQGPRGSENFNLSESVPVLRSTKYPDLRLLYRHPRTNGEPDSFVSVIAAPGCDTRIAQYSGGVKVAQEKLDPSSRVNWEVEGRSVTLTFSDVIPDASVVEKLVEDEDSGHYALSAKLVRPEGEDKNVALSTRQFYPTELYREGLFLSVKDAFGTNVDSVTLDVRKQGEADEKLVLRPGQLWESGGYSVSVIGADAVQGAYVLLGVSYAPALFSLWPVLLMLAGIVVFAFRIAFVTYLAYLSNDALQGREDEQ
ncbi:MAG: hypothetical protein U5N86_13635 [Planctomycetota bacterium]|nr:hypothetical protein [Planctomycetota bacterium]